MDPSRLLPPPQEELLPEHTMNAKTDNGNELKTLLAWSAPGRPFRKRNKEYFLNILIIMLLVEIILFLFSQYDLMVLVVALVFLTYALNTVPPHDFHYKITLQGIMVEDHFFLWQELYDFSFNRQNGEDVLIVGTKAWYPGELTIVLGMMHKEQVRDILLQFLPYREYVKPSFMERSAGWMEKNFPLEKRPHSTSE
ncbi:MAG TPA: hypothetical protein VG935_01590 [Patescibacteria group bacterium]|nr:hypothetical protein [Patescibacteria group bacterium]